MKNLINKSFQIRDFSQAASLLGDPTEDAEDQYLEHLSPAQRYSDESLLGKGALKAVYKCYDHKLKREVALARTKPEANPQYDKKLVYEAWLTSELSHPNIIKIHDIDTDEEGRPFFTMDLKENYTLTDLVKEGVPLSRRLQIFTSICDSIAYAHSKQIIHLDLKPDNIQCGSYGEVLVCDWGLAKHVDHSNEQFEALEHLLDVQDQTLYGTIKGTLGYLSPEQVRPDTPIDHHADLYALGCLLYYLLTDCLLYTSPSPRDA